MIYICIPTHDEQQTVGVVLWKLRQVLTDFPRDYQLLVADDASTDRTADVLEPYTRVLPLTVIRSESRQGYAASLEMLMREAVRRSEYPKRDAIITMQADFSDEPDDVVPLIKRLEAGADVAVGNKVSSTRQTRTRRLARALAGFFTRRQKWPDGVESPFDGYRAYRLYAVKRALEDRAGRRLIQFDGWAAHAQLLRAVLPHARRIDAVNVDDRRDRLQRPSREKAFAAAFQVRTMAAGTEPQSLIGVQELDRIATTASRSRERAAARTALAETPGGRTRDRRQTADGRRSRARANGAGPRKTERNGKRERTQGEGAVVEGRRRKPRPEPAQAAGEAAGAAPAEQAARPKRKRRRGKRSGQSGMPKEQTAAGPSSAEAARAEAPAADADRGEAAESGEAEAAVGDTPERKRRRRGGRRGGRGRRRTRAAEAGSAGSGGTADAEAGVGPVTEAAGPVQND